MKLIQLVDGNNQGINLTALNTVREVRFLIRELMITFIAYRLTSVFIERALVPKFFVAL